MPAQRVARPDRSVRVKSHALGKRQLARIVDGGGRAAHVAAPRVGARFAAAAGFLSPPKVPPISAPLVPTLTLAMPQSLPSAETKRSASRSSLVKIAEDLTLWHRVVTRRSPSGGSEYRTGIGARFPRSCLLIAAPPSTIAGCTYQAPGSAPPAPLAALTVAPCSRAACSAVHLLEGAGASISGPEIARLPRADRRHGLRHGARGAFLARRRSRGG